MVIAELNNNGMIGMKKLTGDHLSCIAGQISFVYSQ